MPPAPRAGRISSEPRRLPITNIMGVLRLCTTESALRAPDVFCPRSFRTLPLFKRDGLPLAQFVETHVRTRRLMEEVLLAVCRRNEPEALAGQRFDRPVHRRHVISVRN